MALTKRSENKIVYLEVKHYCLWRPLKKQVEGCDIVETNNPRTSEKVTKYGYRFDTVSGHAVKLVKYDTEHKYTTRYFGFKIHLVEAGETYVLDMPYNSQILRRFLRVARNVDWALPLSITIFKGKKKDREGDELGVWFQQRGETVKPYYTKEQPHGMPEALYDNDLQQWDFKAQHRWLVDRLKVETVADIEAAAQRVAPPIEPEHGERSEEPTDEGEATIPPHADYISDDDVPF